MTYTRPPAMLSIRRHSVDTLTDSWWSYLDVLSVGQWVTANRALYVPIGVTSRVILRKLWCACYGSFSGNLDIGLYTASGTRLISTGSQAHPTFSTEFVVDVTDTTVGPGLYYMALACDQGASAQFLYADPAVPAQAASGLLYEDSAFPLPATATWSVGQSITRWPIMGFLTESTVA